MCVVHIIVKTLADQKQEKVFFFPIRHWLQCLLTIPSYTRSWQPFAQQSRAFYHWFVCHYLQQGVFCRCLCVFERFFWCFKSAKHALWHNINRERRSLHPGVFLTNSVAVAWIRDIDATHLKMLDTGMVFNWKSRSTEHRRLFETMEEWFTQRGQGVFAPVVLLSLWHWPTFADWGSETNLRHMQVSVTALAGWDVMCVDITMEAVGMLYVPTYRNRPWQFDRPLSSFG